jgi:four helix bundle protein
MTEAELKDRTKTFALRILKLVDALPDTKSGRVLANQLARSGSSVGANYRSACRARSVADMASKLSIVEEEADESAFWLELICEVDLMSREKIARLHAEAGEITAIMVASRKTLLARDRKSKIENRK